MSTTNDFRPDWASPPGNTIAALLRKRALSERDFADRMQRPTDEIGALLAGELSITVGLARQLEQVLGASAEFWMARDYQYRADLERLREREAEWVAQFPIADMVRFGWMRSCRSLSDRIAACLKFFDVSSLAAWQVRYGAPAQGVAFRTSSKLTPQAGSVAVWLRRGEIESAKVSCKDWSPEAFMNQLGEIRKLTREKDPARFLPVLRQLCSDCGVAVAIVRGPSGCRASGAAWFPDPRRAVILLSFRHLTDDHFWFTFFHEAGHLLIHGERGQFVDGVDEVASPLEQQANEFSANILIPPQARAELKVLSLASRSIISFARRIGVSPGIIVGQLQHHGRLEHGHMTSLKRRFTWEE